VPAWPCPVKGKKLDRDALKSYWHLLVFIDSDRKR
jgi:hypothetical protein